MPAKDSLGKGLEAIFTDIINNISERPPLIMCGIEELYPNRFQSRRDFNDKDQEQLITSIKESGIIQPIIARKSDKGYEIIAGERRWRAAQAAGLKDVPVIIREAEDVDAAEISLIENLQRAALNPVEEAYAYQILVSKFGLSQEEVSSRAGKDRSTITNTIRLLKLPSEVKAALIQKKITAGHARPLLTLNSEEEQIKVLRVIIERDLGVRETEKWVKKIKEAPPKRKAVNKDLTIIDLEKELSSKLMTVVCINQSKRAGKIEIKFATKEELNRLVSILMVTED